MIQATFNTIELFGEVAIPTSCGKTIHFEESMLKGTLQIDIAHKDTSEELPTDVLSTTLLISDSNGMVWAIEVKTTTAYLVEKMVDISSSESSIIPASSAPDELKKAFSNETLQGIRYSSDDRFYRSILVGSVVYDFQFHYTTMHFDLAFLKQIEGFDPQLVVHVREDSLFNKGDSLEAFYYFIEWRGLLRSNTAVYSEDYESWGDNFIPKPLTFYRTNKTAEANESVIIS